MIRQLGFGSCKRKLKQDAIPKPYHADNENEAGDSHTDLPRSEYKKREVRRILQEKKNVGNVTEQVPLGMEVEDVMPIHSQVIESRSCAIGTEKEKVHHKRTTVKPANRNVKIQTSYKGPSKAVQCTPMAMSRGTQCELIRPPATSTPVQSDSEEDMDADNIDVDDKDEDYLPSDTSSSSIECDEDSDDNDPDYTLTNKEAKFIVFRTMLLGLFTLCQDCGKKGAKAATTCIGTLLIINQSCNQCGGSFRWLSQPYTGSIPAGNLLLSAAILFSGALPSKVLKVLHFLGVKTYEKHTFFRHQRLYLVPAITRLWRNKQDSLLRSARETAVTLGGDARCDSMGHSAKYGSYTLLDLNKNKILAMELVQSNETAGSYHMELEGLKRCLAVLETVKVEISTLVTDRHSQIQKWLREKRGHITHYYDIWHVAKGTECFEKLTDILHDKFLRKDVHKLSPLGQTYGVESFHSLVNSFAPKMYHFGYAGMKSRLILAVLHYNENSERIQATTNDGKLQYAIAFPKAKQGAHTVKKVMKECTFGYVDDLMLEVMTIVEGTAEDMMLLMHHPIYAQNLNTLTKRRPLLTTFPDFQM